MSAEFSIVTGDPTPEELAAVTAVLTALITEQDEQDRRRQQGHRGPDAWQRSQRQLRTTLHPGPGAWRGFSA